MKGDTTNELERLRAQVEALQQLLEVHERAVVEQAGRLEHALAERRQHTEILTRTNQGLEREIAERKAAEAAVRASEAKLRAILNTAVDGIISIDERGIIVALNPAAQHIFGYQETELLGANVSLLMPSPHREAHDRYLADYLRTGQGKILGLGREVVGRRKDGSTFLMHLAVSEVHPGESRVFTGIIRDITVSKQMERRLAAQHAVTRVLAEAASLPEATPRILQAVCECLEWDVGALWKLDRSANVLRCLEVWRLPTVQVPDFERVTRETTFAPQIGLPGRVWSSGQAAWIRDVVRDTNFPRAPFAAKDGLHGAFGFPIHLGEEVLGVIEFFSHEIRQPDDDLLRMFGAIGSQIGQFIERNRAEEQLRQTSAELARSNADLQQFAYVASHDLQEPLRMVASYLQLIQDRYQGKLDREADEFIGYAVDGARHMRALINDLLAYARLGAKSKPLAPTDSSAALDRALANLEIAVEESGAVITRDPLPTLPADAVQLAQLFQNLVANAIKFRGPQPPRVHVSAERSTEAKPVAWVFFVRDNGIGIESEYFERIFGLFQRLHTREQYPGTGLGLAMCKRIVERHGGRIWLDSKPGEGTTFFFSLPAR